MVNNADKNTNSFKKNGGNKMDITKIDEIIWKETQQAAYEEQCFEHQEQPNEDYFECLNDYLDGTMNV